MKHLTFIITLLFTSHCLVAQDTFQLAPPIINYNSVFFKAKKNVTLNFAQKGATIHYTTNGGEPTILDKIYTTPIVLKKNYTTIKAKVFAQDYLPSETEQAIFIKDGIAIKNIEHPAPNEKYKGSGPNTLFDNKGGFISFQNNTWLGFLQDTITFTIATNKVQSINSVLFQLLQDYKSWIFFPNKVELYCSVNSKMEKQGELVIEHKENKETQIITPFIIPLKSKIKTNLIQLKIYSCNKIPTWHPGKGLNGWAFIDEIKLY